MIYWLPKNIPEIKALPDQEKKQALKDHGRTIWWRFAIFFLIIFVFLNQSVTLLVSKHLPEFNSIMQAFIIWAIEIPLLLFLLLPIYCVLLRREIRKNQS